MHECFCERRADSVSATWRACPQMPQTPYPRPQALCLMPPCRHIPFLLPSSSPIPGQAATHPSLACGFCAGLITKRVTRAWIIQGYLLDAFVSIAQMHRTKPNYVISLSEKRWGWNKEILTLDCCRTSNWHRNYLSSKEYYILHIFLSVWNIFYS